MFVDRTGQRWLCGNVGAVAAALPRTPVLLDHGQRGGRIDVTDDDHAGVFGPVPAVEEGLRVVHLVGHVLDVGEKAHRGVLVRVHAEGDVRQALETLAQWVGVVLQVLTLDRQCLGAELLLAVVEMLEAVRLDLDHLFEVVGGEGGVVVGEVVGGVGVLVTAGRLDDGAVGIRRVVWRAAEHHVLEEMREARLAGLDFVA